MPATSAPPLSSSARTARPKSVIRARPRPSSMTLAGLRSRWRTPLVVRRGQPRAELPRDLDRLVLREPADAAQQRGQVFAVDVLHREEVPPVDLADVVDAADVGVRDLAGEAHLGVEALDPGRARRRARAGGTSARPAGRASGRRRGRPRPCRRGRGGRRCGSAPAGACRARSLPRPGPPRTRATRRAKRESCAAPPRRRRATRAPWEAARRS